jgi:hypothetical protein
MKRLSLVEWLVVGLAVGFVVTVVAVALVTASKLGCQ